MNDRQKSKADNVLENQTLMVIKDGFISCVYLIIGTAPSIVVSWITTTVCRMIIGGPSAIEHIVTFIFCLAAQLVLSLFIFYRRGYDSKNEDVRYLRNVILSSGVIHIILSVILGFSVLISGSAAVNLAEFVYLCIFPNTELPIILASVPIYIIFPVFLATEALYIGCIYKAFTAGKIKRENESCKLEKQTVNN